MKQLTRAALAAVLALVVSDACGQSLEKSYADQCATTASKKSEVCQLMAKALAAKIQGEAAGPSAASTATADQLRNRWGVLLDYIGKPMFQINGETGTTDIESRWVLEWQVPGEVLVRRKVAADGSELGSITYTWSPYTESVERNVASIGQIQTFNVDAKGSFIGTLVMNGTMGRERWTGLGATGYRVTNETNAGHGWVLGNDSMWQLPTSDALASAAQQAALMATMFKNNKEVAAIKAQMQGSMTDEQFEQHLAELNKRNQEYAAARAERRRANNERWSQVLGAIQSGLTAAEAAYEAGANERQAQLDATLVQATSHATQAPSSQPATTSGQAASRPNGGPDQNDSDGMRGAGQQGGSGAPLRFVLSIGMMNLPGDTVNPTCYSNVITRPGPPGWGQKGFLPKGSAESAYATVQAMKSRFISACRSASGREITSDGNFHWTWNENQDGDAQVSDTHARYKEDTTVSL
jgi:hypothetical protein